MTCASKRRCLRSTLGQVIGEREDGRRRLALPDHKLVSVILSEAAEDELTVLVDVVDCLGSSSAVTSEVAKLATFPTRPLVSRHLRLRARSREVVLAAAVDAAASCKSRPV